MYADYDYYQTEFYGSNIEEDEFPRLAMRATMYIDNITMGKAADNADLTEVKQCCCALAEDYQSIELAQKLATQALATALSDVQSSGGEIQSESVGSYSRSTRSGGDSASTAMSAAKTASATLYVTACKYLANTGLLYRGIGGIY